MSDGAPSTVSDAFSAAVTELEVGTSDEPEETEPVEPADVIDQGEQAKSDEEGQAEEQAPAESLFSEDMLKAAAEEAPTIDDDAELSLPGVDGPVTLRELKDGYLRQADYTRKTQGLADDRKSMSEAIEFWDAFEANPKGVISQLAFKAGLIAEEDVSKVTLPTSPFKTTDEVEAEIEKRVKATLAEHPAVVAAEEATAVAAVDTQFKAIEKEHDVKLSDADKEFLLREAQRRQIGDINFVFVGLMAIAQRSGEVKKQVRDAAPHKPDKGSSDEESLTDKPVTSVRDAYTLALADQEA